MSIMLVALTYVSNIPLTACILTWISNTKDLLQSHLTCYLDQNKFTRTWDIQTFLQNLISQLFYELDLLSFSRWPVPKHNNCTVYTNFLNLRYSGTDLNVSRALDIHKNRQEAVPNRCVHVQHAIRTVMTDWMLITWKGYAIGNSQSSMFASKSVYYMTSWPDILQTESTSVASQYYPSYMTFS